MSFNKKILLSFFFLILGFQGTMLFAQSDESMLTNASTTERIRSYRYQSSEMNKKISTLSTSAEYAIKMPVLFGVGIKNLSPNFGDARSGGRTHLGEDIMAIDGTPIVSPTKAVVLSTGIGPSEGLYVYTANPGGETFVYMHLSKIGEGLAEGSILEQGSLIGYVGNTGNASGGAAHLHFEIHDLNRVAVDPFPRLTLEFSLEEKIMYLNNLLKQSADTNNLALLLVTNFRSVFNQALVQNIALPNSIVSALSSVLESASQSTPSIVHALPYGDLEYGSSGVLVVTLQKNLLAKSSGFAVTRLAQAGATGNFGTLTQNALIEYQILMHITPSNGYYGTSTKVVLESEISTPTAPNIEINSNTFTSIQLTQNLHKGMTGEDVLILQKFLNANGYIIASVGAGSVGNETNYFGNATLQAVIKFQISKGITPSVGYVGPLTREFLNSM